jgi:hypothetical protein
MSIGLVDKLAAMGQTGIMVDAQHAGPAMGGVLDVFWNDRRAEQFDESCSRG